MPSMDLTETLNKKKSFIQTTADQNNSLINQLEEEIAEMEQEYCFYGQSYKNSQTNSHRNLRPPNHRH